MSQIEYYGMDFGYGDGFALVKLGGSYSYQKGMANLPHSCDEWIIGGRKQVKALMSDLRKILKDPKLIEDATVRASEVAVVEVVEP